MDASSDGAVSVVVPGRCNVQCLAQEKSVIMMELMRQTLKQVAAKTRYFVSSLSLDWKRLAHSIHSHWDIKNGLHQCLDVTFGENACLVRRTIRGKS